MRIFLILLVQIYEIEVTIVKPTYFKHICQIKNFAIKKVGRQIIQSIKFPFLNHETTYSLLDILGSRPEGASKHGFSGLNNQLNSML